MFLRFFEMIAEGLFQFVCGSGFLHFGKRLHYKLFCPEDVFQFIGKEFFQTRIGSLLLLSVPLFSISLHSVLVFVVLRPAALSAAAATRTVTTGGFPARILHPGPGAGSSSRSLA